MQIRRVGADLSHEARGRTGMTKIIIAFHKCERAKIRNSKLYLTLISRIQKYKALCTEEQQTFTEFCKY